MSPEVIMLLNTLAPYLFFLLAFVFTFFILPRLPKDQQDEVVRAAVTAVKATQQVYGDQPNEEKRTQALKKMQELLGKEYDKVDPGVIDTTLEAAVHDVKQQAKPKQFRTVSTPPTQK